MTNMTSIIALAALNFALEYMKSVATFIGSDGVVSISTDGTIQVTGHGISHTFQSFYDLDLWIKTVEDSE